MNKGLKLFNTITFSLVAMLFALSFSIALPLFIRPFYYLHIDAFNLVEVTGYSKEQLIFSYNELMDSLMFFKTPFSEGVFPFSESGKAHFLDCQILFVLDYVTMFISLIILIIYFVLFRLKKVKIYHPFNLSPVLFMIFVPILILGAFATYAFIDLEGAYVFFHSVFFPGKDNWVFDIRTDPIISALPEQFFVNCGIFIGSVFLLITLSILTYSIIRRIKYKNLKVYKAF